MANDWIYKLRSGHQFLCKFLKTGNIAWVTVEEVESIGFYGSWEFKNIKDRGYFAYMDFEGNGSNWEHWGGYNPFL